VTERDRVLRAAVYAAHDDRGPDGHVRREAVERVVNVHVLWPLIEYAKAIEWAEIELAAQQEQDVAAELEWYASIGILGPDRELAGVC
jgi:hypothetical protein